MSTGGNSGDSLNRAIHLVEEYRDDKRKQNSVICCFVAGAIAGTVSRTVVTPLSVIKVQG
jgi:uncharacterized membrane protein YoaK (UPF0700 family)